MDTDTGRTNDEVDERPVERPSLPALPLVLLVRLYQVTLGVAMGGHCRFQPSCSQYAIEALTVHGALMGSWLTVRRLSRCHPFGGSGYDPVPPNNTRPVATDDSEHHVEAERG